MAKLSGGYQLLELDNIEGVYDFYDPVIQKLIHLDPTVPVIASYKGTTVFGSVSYSLKPNPSNPQNKIGHVSITFTTTGEKLFSSQYGDADKAQIGALTEPVEDNDGNIQKIVISIVGKYEPPGISMKEIDVKASTLTLSSDRKVLTGTYKIMLDDGDFLGITVPVYTGSGFTDQKFPNIITTAKVIGGPEDTIIGAIMYPLDIGVEVTEYSITLKHNRIEIKLTHRGKISYS